MRLEFTKMNGIGNDFVVIDDLDASLDLSPDAVAWFCDRHFGVGADGLILVRTSTSSEADFYMHYFNADGSLAEMCGNGARCFAKYVIDRRLVDGDARSLVIETLGGLKPVTFTRDAAGLMDTATIDMGEPALAPERIPTLIAGPRVFDHPLETPFGVFSITAVSMGNPHVVIWVDDVESAPVETAGPFIERHEMFPNGTNVEFAQIADDGAVRVRVWERGVGETLACGTGACAVTVAGTLSGATGREVTVELPGGDLLVSWNEDGHVYLTGSAAISFEGTIEMLEDVE